MHVKNKIEAAKTRSPQFDERNNCSTIRYRRFTGIVGTDYQFRLSIDMAEIIIIPWVI